MITFRVLGTPAAQGSKRHVGNGIMVESSKRLKPWRDSVASAAFEEMGGREPLTGAISLVVRFTFLRPKSHYGTGRNADITRLSAPHHHTQKPDTDKLERAVLDALTKIAFRDDSQVVALHGYKAWSTVFEGAHISIQELS